MNPKPETGWRLEILHTLIERVYAQLREQSDDTFYKAQDLHKLLLPLLREYRMTEQSLAKRPPRTDGEKRNGQTERQKPVLNETASADGNVDAGAEPPAFEAEESAPAKMPPAKTRASAIPVFPAFAPPASGLESGRRPWPGNGAEPDDPAVIAVAERIMEEKRRAGAGRGPRASRDP